MRKILSRLATFVLVLVVMISFSACALFTTDLDKKYSPYTLVAMAGKNDLTISRQELYYGYLEWGYQYADSMDSDQLLEYITLALMNNKILERKSIEQFGELYDVEIALAKKQAYDALNSTLRSYIFEALGQDDPDANDNTADDTNDVDQAYKPGILVGYENGERVFTMDLSSYVDTDGVGRLELSDYDFYTPAVPGSASTKVAKQAVSKVVRNLQAFEKGFTQLKAPAVDYLPTDNVYLASLTKDERAVLNREIDRMVRSNQTAILVERINTAYNLGFMSLMGDDEKSKANAKQAWKDYLFRDYDFEKWSDLINGNPIWGDEEDLPAYYGCGRAVATNTADNAIKFYIEKVTNAIESQKNFPDSDLESTLVSSGLADVYYIPTDVANNLYTVSHILIGFTDEQKAAYANIQAEGGKNPSYDVQKQLTKLQSETASNGVSASDILVEVKTALGKADSLEEKYRIFRQFINQYNSDPGMQNLDQLSSSNKPQYEYLMSADADKSQMVEEFTAASIELFEKGIKGEISGLVWTDYGAHIIMYTRNVADFVYTSSADPKTAIKSVGINYANSLFATLTAYGNRTRFDTLVDSYFTRSYTNYRNGLLNDYKMDHKVTIVSSEFKTFFK